MEWRLKFQEGGLKHLIRNQSDHMSILISTIEFTMIEGETKLFQF